MGTYFVYAVFVLGVVLVLMSDDVWSFGDTWIWLSMLLYVVGIGLSHGILQPNVRRMIGLMEELTAGTAPPGAGGPPPQAAELAERGRWVGCDGATLNVLLVVLLYLRCSSPARRRRRSAHLYDGCVSFYDEVLRELIAAVGAALFVGNLVALIRRRRDPQTAPAAPGRSAGSGAARSADLAQAPAARTVVYMVLGFVVMVWGIASFIVG